MEDKQKKREVNILSAQYYKNILDKWDNAIQKTEGRKPGKADLKKAPESIQKAYKQYHKLLSYLTKTSSSANKESSSRSNGLTPQKIFYPSRSSLKKSNTANIKRKASILKEPTEEVLKKVGGDFNRFSEKVFNAVNILTKDHRTIKVIEQDSGKEVTRKALIPNRFIKTTTDSSSGHVASSGHDTRNVGDDTTDACGGNSTGNSSLFMEFENEIETVQIDGNKPGPSCTIPTTKLNSVSAVWQNLSPNPKSKNPKSEKLISVDSDWLLRCGIELDIEGVENDINIDIPHIDQTTEIEDCTTLKENNEGLFSQGFQKLLLGPTYEQPDQTTTAKSPLVSTASVKSKPDNTATAKPPTVSKTSVKSKPDKTTTAKLPPVSKTSGKSTTAKSPPVSKTSVKSKKSMKKDLFEAKQESNEVRPSSSHNQVTASEYFDETAPASTSTGRKGKGRRPRLTNKEHLQSKIDNGKLNENFVRIDITKKVFVRGKKRISGAKVKRNDWKLKKASASKEDKMKSLTCRKCGETGHFAKFCMKDMTQKEEPDEIDDSPFPTLEEVARMAKAPSLSKRVNIYAAEKPEAKEIVENSQLSADLDATSLKCVETKADFVEDLVINLPVKSVPPYFGYGGGSMLCSQEEEEAILNGALKKFGYDEFRGGQYESISRVLKGLSTLVILSTGSGKSLCYQLPAYLYAMKYPGALAICVSPLVSLMEDQVQGIPPFLEAACLHSNMVTKQKEKVLERIRSKKLHVLLVSPEAVCGGLFGLLRGGNDLPRISFACIDEVHCVSQWSHNFRPCYLQLSKILREKLNISTILGLTATATASTAMSICDHLQVDPSTTIRGEILPCNLNLSVSRDTYREEGLLILLRGERFKECESIIIYCTRREECERIAVLIRTNIQDIPAFNQVTKTNLRQRVSNNCEAYHAGMTPARRRLVQQQFMSGKIRIVVATVAFGMGIDKADIRSVIHYNMPKAFESYVQEIGRAGRDGLPAHCHLFLDNVKGRDLSELRRHVYSNSVDRATLRKLLRKVFLPCKCDRIAEISNTGSQSLQGDDKKRCTGHEVSFNINDTVNELDLPQENITTLLCYLELDKSKRWIEMLSHTYQTCKIHSYGGAKLLKSCALKCPPLAAAIALQKEQKKFKETDSYLEFNVIEVSATLGWNSGIVKRELKNLEWSGTDFDDSGNSKRFRKSGILVEFCDLAFHLNAPGDLTDEEADIVLNYLHKHNLDQERSQLYQLNRVYQALQSISSGSVDGACDTFDGEKSEMLKKFIHHYFTKATLGVPADWKNETSQDEGKRDEIIRDVQNIIFNYRDIQFSARSIAKIFQGISSPCFPSDTWARNRAYWRKHLEVDFGFLCQVAGQEILRLQ